MSELGIFGSKKTIPQSNQLHEKGPLTGPSNTVLSEGNIQGWEQTGNGQGSDSKTTEVLPTD